MSTIPADSPETKLTGPLSREKVLQRMDDPTFWDSFFHCFLSTVHPAEFALTDKDEKGSQRETALSAAFQRVFLASGHLLGLSGWFCALEAPVAKKGGRLAYCDLTLFPWDACATDPWSVKSQPGEHIRIEVKWRDNNCFGSTGITPKLVVDAADENQSDQHFALMLVFHGKEDLPIHTAENWDFSNSEWSKLAIFKEPRRYAKFSEKYDHFTLAVLKKAPKEGVS